MEERRILQILLTISVKMSRKRPRKYQYMSNFGERAYRESLDCFKRVIKIANLLNFNHGQKSSDKFAFLALLGTRQTKLQLHLPNLVPTPIQCWKLLPAISSDFQHCIGWGVGRATRL